MARWNPAHGSPAGSAPGLTCAWVDPLDPAVWSGVTASLAGALTRRGSFAGWLDVTSPTARTAARLPGAGRRAVRHPFWYLGQPWATLDRLAARYRSTPAKPPVWIVPLSDFEAPPGARFAALGEMSPTQLERYLPRWHRSYGLAHLPAADLARYVARQRRLVRGASVVLAATRWMAASLIADDGVDERRVHVVGWGVNASFTPNRSRRWDVPRFVWVGRDWDRKNGAAVLRAFPRVRQAHPDATLVIVGADPGVPVGPGVEVHADLTLAAPGGRSAIQALYDSATCVVLPSHVEAFGMVHLEAGTAGLPSIGTAEGGAIDAMGSGGVAVDPADDAGISAAMLEMADGDRAATMGAAAAAHARGRDWDAVAAAVAGALGETASVRRVSR